MTTKASFSASEWKSLVNAPYQILLALKGAERTGMVARRRESKALEAYLSESKSSSGLVKSIIADQDDADDNAKADSDEAIKALSAVGALLERKADDDDGDAARAFLVGAGKAIAEAFKEERGRKKDEISDAEEAVLGRIEKALKATSADTRRRATSCRCR